MSACLCVLEALHVVATFAVSNQVAKDAKDVSTLDFSQIVLKALILYFFWLEI